MKCQDIGFIQAYLDGELNRDERKQYIQHLDHCKACQKALEEVSKLNQWGEVVLDDEFTNVSEEIDIDVEQAWKTFEQNIQNHKMEETNSEESKKKGRWHNMKKSSKRWITAAAAAAVVCVSLTVPEVRAGANNLLSIFRVKDVQFVQLTDSDLREIEGWISNMEEGEKSIKGIGKIGIKDNGSKKDAHFQSEQQAREAGYAVPKVPNGYRVTNVDVNSSFIMQFELDTEKANKLLKQLQSNTEFESALNGKQFSITVPESVRTQIEVEGNRTSRAFSYNVIDAPKISVPEGVNVTKLQKTVLELPIIPGNVKTQLAGIQDWTHTLPIPYVAKGAKVSETKVQGVKAVLYSAEYENVLIWEKDGKMHMVEQHKEQEKELNANDLIKLANELK
ncbi:anti-sigma factor family protein [Bacillus sp. UNC437CL72CviS29]|uniref:anti-sigma factor family protein n=1 Tax=Bacillus sp. UNC437CL72CviS29 TaxID=1340430 RepID=UPI00047A6BEF|nr:zf-HC2 domain-containing protein [Bacillus sp. UNC437CL72CviS29]